MGIVKELTSTPENTEAMRVYRQWLEKSIKEQSVKKGKE